MCEARDLVVKLISFDSYSIGYCTAKKHSEKRILLKYEKKSKDLLEKRG